MFAGRTATRTENAEKKTVSTFEPRRFEILYILSDTTVTAEVARVINNEIIIRYISLFFKLYIYIDF